MEGRIIKGVGGSYVVRCDDSDYVCHARGILRYKGIKPMIGDRVCLECESKEKMTGNILQILPRKNALIRPAAANIDQAVIQFALKDPAPNLNLLDRFLLQMEKQKVPVIICLNKIDIAGEGEYSRISGIYEKIGYICVPVCAATGKGVPRIKELINGKTTVWAGPSGVGKSSLINLLAPESSMETGSISEKIKRGKHTTRHVQLLSCGGDTYVCDTPGFSSINPPDVEPEELQFYFSEFEKYTNNCRFKGCVHIGEKECGVKQAVDSGLISHERYDNYRLLYNELKNKKKY